MKALACLPAIALVLTAATACTEQPAPVPESADGLACPPFDANGRKDFAPFIEAMITPGKVMDFADLIKSVAPETRARMAAYQKAETERRAKDWPYLCRYAAENAAVLASGTRPRVVFLGDSITENWKIADPALFATGSLDRGISGQTTPQILLRFTRDVVALRPRVVHIMAGTNDISGNTGPVTDDVIVDNISAMIDIAKANRVSVVLASITPSSGFSARPGFNPAARIAAVNRRLVQLAARQGVTYVDYGPALDDGAGGFKAALANDGLHPNRDGYAVMRPLAEQAIARAAR